MTHAELWEAIGVYRDLRGAEREEVDRHLAGCAECSSLLNAYRVMDRNLAGLRDARPDNRLREGFLHAAIGERQAAPGVQRGRAAPHRVQFVVFATAALLLLLVASAVALWPGWSPERANTIGRPLRYTDPNAA